MLPTTSTTSAAPQVHDSTQKTPDGSRRQMAFNVVIVAALAAFAIWIAQVSTPLSEPAMFALAGCGAWLVFGSVFGMANDQHHERKGLRYAGGAMGGAVFTLLADRLYHSGLLNFRVDDKLRPVLIALLIADVIAVAIVAYRKPSALTRKGQLFRSGRKSFLILTGILLAITLIHAIA
jgi:hypothetical protein